MMHWCDTVIIEEKPPEKDKNSSKCQVKQCLADSLIALFYLFIIVHRRSIPLIHGLNDFLSTEQQTRH